MAHLKSKSAVRTSAFLHILGCCFLHTPPFSWTFSLIFDLLHRSKLWIPPRLYLITSKPQLPGCQVWVCGKKCWCLSIFLRVQTNFLACGPPRPLWIWLLLLPFLFLHHTKHDPPLGHALPVPFAWYIIFRQLSALWTSSNPTPPYLSHSVLLLYWYIYCHCLPV